MSYEVSDDRSYEVSDDRSYEVSDDRSYEVSDDRSYEVSDEVVYQKNRIVDLTEQSSSYYKYINKVAGVLLSPDDILSISSCRKILYANPLLHNILTFNMTEANAVKMIQLTSTCASIYYQYIFPATWFHYFMSTFSGIKKIYHFIFENPVYGILFYCTFYFKILDTYDKEKFNQVASVLYLPNHEDAMSRHFLDAIVDNSSRYMEVSIEYKEQAETLMRKIASSILYTAGKMTIDKIFVQVLEQSTQVIESIKQPAIYILDRDRFDFDDSVIQDQLSMLRRNKSNIKSYMRQQGVKLKNKK